MLDLQILSRLIEARSISPNDAGLIHYVSCMLEQSGFLCHTKTFGEGEKQTTNLYAEFGSCGKNLCFVGHVDVVPSGPYSDWSSDPFEMKIKGGYIYGRGAVDMKGAVFCMISALINWAKNGMDSKVSILLTSDEEGVGTYGTNKMLEWMESQGIKIDFAIVGEPTSEEEFGDTIKIGRRGSIACALSIFGVQGHVAYHKKAKNPHKDMIAILQKLQNHKIDEGNEFFDPSNLEILSIDTVNKVSNMIPGSTKALFNIRNSNAKTVEEIIQEIRCIISEQTHDFDLMVHVSAQPFISNINEFTDKFRDIVAQEIGILPKYSTSGGTSDARFIKNYSPVLEFGLLNTTAHKVDEYTEISHLQKLYKVYIGCIKSFHEIESL